MSLHVEVNYREEAAKKKAGGGGGQHWLQIKASAASERGEKSPVIRRSLIIGIDVSTSMYQEMRSVQATLRTVYDYVTRFPGCELTCIAYNERAWIVWDPSDVQNNSKERFDERISQLTAGGMTDIEAALNLLFRVKVPEVVTNIILLTDGEPTRGASTPEEFQHLVQRHTDFFTTITAIGYGPLYRYEILQAIGRFVHMPNPQCIAETMGSILGELLTTQFVGVRFDCPSSLPIPRVGHLSCPFFLPFDTCYSWLWANIDDASANEILAKGMFSYVDASTNSVYQGSIRVEKLLCAPGLDDEMKRLVYADQFGAIMHELATTRHASETMRKARMLHLQWKQETRDAALLTDLVQHLSTELEHGKAEEAATYAQSCVNQCANYLPAATQAKSPYPASPVCRSLSRSVSEDSTTTLSGC